MIALLDNGQDLETCGAGVGQLLTPLTRYRLRDPNAPWAIDNGGFSQFDQEAFLALLAREDHHKERCLFVTAPDVVASARRTLEIFDRWKDRLDDWKVALKRVTVVRPIEGLSAEWSAHTDDMRSLKDEQWPTI